MKTKKLIKLFFNNSKPLKDDLPVIINNPKYLFKDESWEHIQKFTKIDEYPFIMPDKTNFQRINDDGNNIKILSTKKKKNWNLFYYKNAAASNFEFSFDIIAHQKLSEIQISFKAADLRNRYRFMIRDNNTAVFELIKNGDFYRFLKKKKVNIELHQKYHIRVVVVNKNYQFYLNDELVFSINDRLNFIKGRDIIMIFYNKDDNFDVDCDISNIILKNKTEYKNKVGIITFHKSINYGAYLQAYCLSNRLNQEKNIDCEIIDYSTIKEKIVFHKSFIKSILLSRSLLFQKVKFRIQVINNLKKAQKNLKKSNKSVVSNKINKFEKLVKYKYDAIITGSDEVYKIDGIRGFPNAYWLWNNLNSAKLAYAASSRSGFPKITDAQKITNNLKTYSYISVRDQITLNNIKLLVDNVDLQPDPSFIYDLPLNDIDILKTKYHINNNKKNIVLFCGLSINDYQKQLLVDKLGKEYNLISVFFYSKGMINIPNITPLELVSIIKDADLVITDHYHGVCFSIVYNTPYLALGVKNKKDKLLSLNNKDTDLDKRYIDDINKFINGDVKQIVEEKMIYFDNSKYLDSCRLKFNDFLKELNDALNIKSN